MVSKRLSGIFSNQRLTPAPHQYPPSCKFGCSQVCDLLRLLSNGRRVGPFLDAKLGDEKIYSSARYVCSVLSPHGSIPSEPQQTQNLLPPKSPQALTAPLNASKLEVQTPHVKLAVIAKWPTMALY